MSRLLLERAGPDVIIPVRVVVRASRTELAGAVEGVLRIRLAAPPVDGAANDALIRFIAKRLKVARSSVTVVSGVRSRSKRVRVGGVTVEEVEAVFRADRA